ncbi:MULTISPECIES: DUF1990 family protein [unclassified Brachybacterium]|uniref:DUF1990 family protein n=1 Tax=unclassified Brachybacterium TaxID=2623841 RepID=UPI0040345F10
MNLPEDLTCPDPGITAAGQIAWSPHPTWGSAFTASKVIGTGQSCWDRASRDVLQWAVKTRSGFALAPSTAAPFPGQTLTIIASLGPLRVREPAVVLDVIGEQNRVALSYATRRGHPVRGEEAFIVHRDERGTVTLTLRSVTAAAPGWRGLLFPAALVLQRRYRRLYLRSLR